ERRGRRRRTARRGRRRRPRRPEARRPRGRRGQRATTTGDGFPWPDAPTLSRILDGGEPQVRSLTRKYAAARPKKTFGDQAARAGGRDPTSPSFIRNAEATRARIPRPMPTPIPASVPRRPTRKANGAARRAMIGRSAGCASLAWRAVSSPIVAYPLARRW